MRQSGIRSNQGSGEGEFFTPSVRRLPDLFVGAAGKAIVLPPNAGDIFTVNASRARLAQLWEAHAAGVTRLGLSPVRRDGTCRWGAIDLDAHADEDPHRLDDALRVARGLATLALTPYLHRSRHGRGLHVFVFLDEPGARAADLHALLVAFAAEVRPSDVRPSGPCGRGSMIFLPGFAGAPLLDADLVPIDPAHVELSEPALVRAAIGETARREPAPQLWPPRFWKAPAGGTDGGAWRGLDDVRDLIFAGVDGFPRARRGARNRIAGRAAGRILRSGGELAAFAAWDRGNDPPLATDEPARLQAWWTWAVRKARTRSNGGRSE